MIMMMTMTMKIMMMIGCSPSQQIRAQNRRPIHLCKPPGLLAPRSLHRGGGVAVVCGAGWCSSALEIHAFGCSADGGGDGAGERVTCVRVTCGLRRTFPPPTTP
jgi:hypothetical protein